jgi:hypothetical protein
MRTKNHKLNRAVQAMLFGMVERGMDGEVVGDKGKNRAKPVPAAPDGTAKVGDEAMWAVVVTKELWRKGVWCVTPLYISCIRCLTTKDWIGTIPRQCRSWLWAVSIRC